MSFSLFTAINWKNDIKFDTRFYITLLLLLK